VQQSSSPISGKTRLYGLFADPVEHLQVPGLFNALLAQRGIDAVVVPLHVTAEHLATIVTGMRHLRNFAGYGVSMPHKGMAASLCDELMPNARACGVVNHIRVDPDGRWIGETLDGVGMVKALQAQRTLDAHTRVLLVGAGGTGRAIASAHRHGAQVPGEVPQGSDLPVSHARGLAAQVVLAPVSTAAPPR
jgi:shikimate dehydrogenase